MNTAMNSNLTLIMSAGMYEIMTLI